MQKNYPFKRNTTISVKINIYFFIAFLSLFFQINVFSQISPDAMVLKMNRGINLGNVLSAPVEGNWQDSVEESYFIDIAEVGFKTVRIPADFFGERTTGDTSSYSKDANTENLYTGSSSDYIVDASYLDRIEEVVSWSLEHDLVTILDFHGSTLKTEFLETHSPKEKYAALYTNPSSAKRIADNEKFRAIWTQIAEVFKDYSYDLVFEIVNESYFYLSATEMDQLNADIISIIRNSGGNNQYRNIIITGGGKNSFEAPMQIADEILESDSYLIPTFHYYLPRNFTASSNEDHNDFDWGTAEDKLQIDTDFGVVKTWAEEKSVSILLGEFGADNEGGYNYSTQTYGLHGGPENDSRVLFHKYLAQKAIDLGFSFTVWDAGDKSNKSIYLVNQDFKWVTDVRNAVLGIDCLQTDLISNSDIECGVNTDWSLYVNQNNASATLENSAEESAYSGAKAVEINVNTSGSTFGTVVLKNKVFDQNNLSEKYISIAAFSKGSLISEVEKFKFRLKIKNNNDEVTYSTSNEIELKETYKYYQYQTQLPDNVKSVEFQIICGSTEGTLYFDDFKSSISNSPILGLEEHIRQGSIQLYPNPFRDVLHSSALFSKIEIFDVLGKLILIKKNSNIVDTSNFKEGMYLAKIFNSKGKVVTKTIIKIL